MEEVWTFCGREAQLSHMRSQKLLHGGGLRYLIFKWSLPTPCSSVKLPREWSQVSFHISSSTVRLVSHQGLGLLCSRVVCWAAVGNWSSCLQVAAPYYLLQTYGSGGWSVDLDQAWWSSLGLVCASENKSLSSKDDLHCDDSALALQGLCPAADLVMAESQDLIQKCTAFKTCLLSCE